MIHIKLAGGNGDTGDNNQVFIVNEWDFSVRKICFFYVWTVKKRVDFRSRCLVRKEETRFHLRGIEKRRSKEKSTSTPIWMKKRGAEWRASSRLSRSDLAGALCIGFTHARLSYNHVDLGRRGRLRTRVRRGEWEPEWEGGWEPECPFYPYCGLNICAFLKRLVIRMLCSYVCSFSHHKR